ncbi:MAG: hypothetical protein OK454_10325, partial [Thaumarchaeota archaeon]|nr:hypothetical protein [Nitrososphaerota archaeon]
GGTRSGGAWLTRRQRTAAGCAPPSARDQRGANPRRAELRPEANFNCGDNRAAGRDRGEQKEVFDPSVG